MNSHTYIGTVVHMGKDRFVLSPDATPNQTVIVTFDPQDVDLFFETGSKLIVETNGAVALSQPPQVHATSILQAPLVTYFTAVVKEVSDELLVTNTQGDDPYFNQDIVVGGAVPDDVRVGDALIIGYTGMMTRSIPPQVVAIECVSQETE